MNELAVHLLYFTLLSAVVVGLVTRLRRRPEEGPWLSLLVGGAASVILAAGAARLFPHPIFGSMALLCRAVSADRAAPPRRAAGSASAPGRASPR